MLPSAADDHTRIGRMITRLLAVRFFAAMGLVLVVAVVHQVLVQGAVARQAADARTVDEAGRQRMLAFQVAASLCSEAGEHGIEASRARLESVLAQWRRGHAGMEAGDPALGFPPGLMPAELKARLDPHFHRLSAAAAAAVAGDPPGAYALPTLVEDAHAFAATMDVLVHQLATEADGRVARLRWLQAGLFLALALLLGFVDLFVFRPSIRRARQALEDLEQVKKWAVEQEVAEASGRLERRIGQDLHDGVGQRLTGAAMMAKALSRRLEGRPEAEHASDIVHELNEAVAETRALSRQLFPAAADAEGLEPALRDLAGSTARHAGVECTCDWDDDLPLPAVPPGEGTPAPMHIYRIVQEAVSNAVRHGQAKRIRIGGRRDGDHGLIEVVDDGVGLSATAAAPSMGLGLRTMTYRAGQLGAELKVGEEYGGGTAVRLRWKLEPTPALASLRG